ncbi:MAG: hypothetical protein QXP55_03580 [Nitrososphaerales archaeon]
MNIRRAGSLEIQIRRHNKPDKLPGIAPEELTIESPLFRSFGKFLKRDKEVKHLTAHSASVIIRKRL